MKKNFSILFFFLLINTQFLFSQEWKSIKDYQKITGNTVLENGSWLKKDRKRNTKTWKQANKFNLVLTDGNMKYKTISQIRDFYFWLDDEFENQGHEINTVGVVAIVADQLSNFDNWFIREIIVRNKEVVWFGNEGSKGVLSYAFPLLQEVYNSKNILKDEAAKKWDLEYMKKEQCQIVEPLYNRLSAKAIKKLNRIAKGKGIFNLGVKNELKYEGDILDCNSRTEHAFLKVLTYYLKSK